MPGTTTPRAFPYPLSTDPIADGASAMQALAEAIETKVPRVYSGTTVINLNNQVWVGNMLTFPTAFNSAPVVVASMAGGSVAHFAAVGSVTTTGFEARAIHRDNTTSTATITVSWIAVGY